MASSPSDLPGEIAELVLDVAAQATMLGREAARAGGVDQSPTGWFALAELQDAGAMRLGVLARRLGIRQPAASALVQRLESRAWIRRNTDPVDRRANELQITVQGREVLAGWRRSAAEALAEILHDLDQADRDNLERVLLILTRCRSLRAQADEEAAAAVR